MALHELRSKTGSIVCLELFVCPRSPPVRAAHECASPLLALTPPLFAQDALRRTDTLATPSAKTIAIPASNQLSVRCTTAQKMAITAFSHPFGAGKMTLPSALGAFWFPIRIDVQHDIRNFAPIASVRVSV